MKKLPTNPLVVLGVFGAAFLLPMMAFAQTTPSGHFVFISQGVISTNDYTTYSTVFGQYENADWTVKLGSGYSGDITGAFTYTTGTNNTSGQGYPWYVTFEGFTDSSYSTGSSTCTYDSQNLSGGETGFIELTYHVAGDDVGEACNLDPSLYYEVQLSYENKVSGSGSPWVTNPQFYGIADYTTLYPTWSVLYGSQGAPSGYPNFAPYFAAVGDGFTITPSASSTGLFLSGAQEFCNGQFGTSSAGVFGIGTDIANGTCQAVGYLFVPTPASLSQFTGLTTALQSKIPFSYAYGVATIFQDLAASSTQNFPGYSMPLSELDFSSSTAMGPILPTNLDFLSSTTINQFLPVGMHDLLYNLMIYVIWVDVAFVLYRKIVPNKAKI